jgi:hypothetical protein
VREVTFQSAKPARVQDHRAVEHFGRQVAQGFHLALGQTRGAQRIGARGKHLFRRDIVIQGRDETAVDGTRRDASELLVHDRAD